MAASDGNTAANVFDTWPPQRGMGCSCKPWPGECCENRIVCSCGCHALTTEALSGRLARSVGRRVIHI